MLVRCFELIAFLKILKNKETYKNMEYIHKILICWKTIIVQFQKKILNNTVNLHTVTDSSIPISY